MRMQHIIIECEVDVDMSESKQSMNADDGMHWAESVWCNGGEAVVGTEIVSLS